MYHAIHARFSCITISHEISNNEDEPSSRSAPSDEDRKLKNVDACPVVQPLQASAERSNYFKTIVTILTYKNNGSTLRKLKCNFLH